MSVDGGAQPTLAVCGRIGAGDAFGVDKSTLELRSYELLDVADQVRSLIRLVKEPSSGG